MDFSSDVLIDFGLNLAGYLVAATLIYVLMGRRGRQKVKMPKIRQEAVAVPKQKPVSKVTVPNVTAVDSPEFIPLDAVSVSAGSNPDNRTHNNAGIPEIKVAPKAPATRQENRRAIYREARRLLASGKPRGDLLRQLPLTEGELEMLSIAGKA